MYNKYRASFSGERRYLSNMYLVPFIYNKKVFKSSESIYMLFKNNSKEWWILLLIIILLQLRKYQGK